MATNEFITTSYLDEARSRVTELFKDKVVFDKYLQLFINEQQALQQVFKDLMQKRSLDTATGAVLDIIGDIVGQPRTIINSAVIPAESITLDDITYRFFIKAKIARNNTDCTPESIMNITNLLFQATGSVVAEEGNAAYSIMIGKLLSNQEKALLKYVLKEEGYFSQILPKPAGVRVNYKGEFDGNNFFAFSGVPNAEGFGSLSDPTIGGKFAGLL